MDDQLKPWHGVATPHEDIREGRFAEDTFAANLWAVVRGNAPDVYMDPEEFFRKTYMTKGLAGTLNRVGRVLKREGGTGDRILSLQTSFGGGKTHILIALWHLARHSERLSKSAHAGELREALGGEFPPSAPRLAVFTNLTCDATQGRDTEHGVHTFTLWGELALQLGGPDLYEKVRANDENRSVPQGLFVDILKEASPCLMLLDELADYCVGAASVGAGTSTLADQTVSFMQQLTEAVQQVPGTAVVATLPASKLEVAQSQEGQEAFVTLEKRFHRLGADSKPVADEEIYDVVRARLFESIAPPDEPDYPAKAARAYHEMYADHQNDVPNDAAKRSYQDRLERAYPFHPELIEAFYTRWGSHPDFQRTRSVLRLLGCIVGDLWNRRKTDTRTQHFIQPSHVNWSLDPLQGELSRLWGQAYQSVVAADVCGENANSVAVDDERGSDYQREAITEGLASAVMLGSFGGEGERAGFSAKDLKLACSRAGVNWNYLDGAILGLDERCFYLHSAQAGSLGKRYWFGTRPNLNRLFMQYRQEFEEKDFKGEILEDLRSQGTGGMFSEATWKVLVDPDRDLAEQKSLCLLIFPPSLSWDDGEEAEMIREKVMEISRKCGNQDRKFRNTLLFLAPTKRGASRLRTAYRDRATNLALRDEYGDQLDDEQRADLNKRLEKARQDVREKLPAAYTVALQVDGTDVRTAMLDDAGQDFAEHLKVLWRELIENREWILKRVGGVTLQEAGLVPEEGTISVKDAIEAFLRYTDKHMLAHKRAVTDGLERACQDGIIGIARGTSPSNLKATFCAQSVSLDPGEDGVWIIPPFEPESEPEPTPGGEPAPTGGTGGTEPGTEPTGGGTPSGGEPTPGTGVEPPEPANQVHRIKVQGSVPMESWSDLFRSFIGPASRMNLKNVNLGINFELRTAENEALDENDQTLQAMKEAARQLGLDMETEE